jgi:hypothetical protein
MVTFDGGCKRLGIRRIAWHGADAAPPATIFLCATVGAYQAIELGGQRRRRAAHKHNVNLREGQQKLRRYQPASASRRSNEKAAMRYWRGHRQLRGKKKWLEDLLADKKNLMLLQKETPLSKNTVEFQKKIESLTKKKRNKFNTIKANQPPITHKSMEVTPPKV